MGDFWVFGYGSLIWSPGFEFVEQHKAKLRGFHRALCIHSWHYRGTAEVPGLVLGLDRGGSCEGIARRVLAENGKHVIAYLRERELVFDVYRESWVDIALQDGRKVKAVTYVAARQHEQYAAPMSLEQTAEIVFRAKGKTGSNRDYVENTVRSFKLHGIHDIKLEAICRKIAGL